MYPLQKQFHDFITAHRLIDEGENVLLAVSGGVDSMVMFDLFKNAGVPIAIAHCNYGLRGRESDEDEALVVECAEKDAIPCYIKKMEIKGNSVQLEARDQRYGWLKELKEKNGYAKVAAAHHLDDALETTLFNLTRGTGIKGLKGIAPRNDDIIRPMLFSTKKQLIEYARTKGLKWREDQSNQKTDYARNKIRLEVIPRLKEINPSLLTTYRATQERMQFLSEIVIRRVEEIKQEFFDASSGKLKLNWMQEHSDLIVLSNLLAIYGFNYKTVKEIFEARNKPGKVFPGEDYTVMMDRNSLFIRGNKKEAQEQEFIIKSEGTYRFVGHDFVVETITLSDESLNQGNNVALFEKALITFPMKIRRWKEGDVFTPLGMSGKKKISDFLIDEKVPVALKRDILVVEIGGQIAWLVGYRISEKFKVRNKENVLRIKMS
ncbi:MAG: tRNA lysidine(34) synthetase TilS [Ekhidna sp.]|nr:tRNA lysidine(34) synthetase TilS [Ekhidna sp.]